MVTRSLPSELVRLRKFPLAPASSSEGGRICEAARGQRRALKGELAETAIRVTEIQPGLTRTNIILTRYRGDRQKEKDYVQIAEMMILPLKRY